MIFDADSIEIEDKTFAATLVLVTKLSGWSGYIDFRIKALNQAVLSGDGPGRYVHKPWPVRIEADTPAEAAEQIIARYSHIVSSYIAYMAQPADEKVIFMRDLIAEARHN